MIIIRAMQMRIIFMSALATASLALAACGSDDDDGGGDGPRVVATTGIVADIVQSVAGPELEVEQLIPDGSSPHDFQLSAQDRQVIAEADLVVANGANLEPGIPLDDASALWQLTDHAGELLPFAEGGGDPHVWMDPTRVAEAIPSLADALADVEPENADAYRDRAGEYTDELRSLDRELQNRLSRVPAADRELVTSHDALAYFAEHFSFEVVATAFPASGAEAEPSASALDEVADAITERDVPAVFAGEEDDPEVLRQVAEEADVEVVDDLLIESTGSAGTYEAMLEHDAGRIADALGE